MPDILILKTIVLVKKYGRVNGWTYGRLIVRDRESESLRIGDLFLRLAGSPTHYLVYTSTRPYPNRCHSPPQTTSLPMTEQVASSGRKTKRSSAMRA